MNEMENQKELLLTYEQTLAHKDSIVANITEAIQKQVSSIFILTFLYCNHLLEVLDPCFETATS